MFTISSVKTKNLFEITTLASESEEKIGYMALCQCFSYEDWGIQDSVLFESSYILKVVFSYLAGNGRKEETRLHNVVNDDNTLICKTFSNNEKNYNTGINAPMNLSYSNTFKFPLRYSLLIERQKD